MTDEEATLEAIEAAVANAIDAGKIQEDVTVLIWGEALKHLHTKLKEFKESD